MPDIERSLNESTNKHRLKDKAKEIVLDHSNNTRLG